jgi:hypothetical protein
MRWILGVSSLFLACVTGVAQPPKAKEPPAVVALLDDVGTLARQLTNDGSMQPTPTDRDFRDCYAGVCSLRVKPLQRFGTRLPGWFYPIAEKPGPGQYRYLRFAWKRVGGDGIIIQIHATNGQWNHRYLAGKRRAESASWGPVIPIAALPPRDWVVVTRDLYTDFGTIVIVGMAFTPLEGGGVGLFDHVYLGRSLEDLDRASAADFGKPALTDALAPKALDKLWQELASKDERTARAAVRRLLAGRKEGVPFLCKRLQDATLTIDEEHLLKLIADLDSKRYAARETASRELEKLGLTALPYLEKAVREGPSLEARRRAQDLLDKQARKEDPLTPEQAQALRAIRVLGWSEMAEARRTLKRLAGQALVAGLRDDARRALRQLTKAP